MRVQPDQQGFNRMLLRAMISDKPLDMEFNSPFNVTIFDAPVAKKEAYDFSVVDVSTFVSWSHVLFGLAAATGAFRDTLRYYPKGFTNVFPGANPDWWVWAAPYNSWKYIKVDGWARVGGDADHALDTSSRILLYTAAANWAIGSTLDIIKAAQNQDVGGVPTWKIVLREGLRIVGIAVFAGAVHSGVNAYMKAANTR